MIFPLMIYSAELRKKRNLEYLSNGKKPQQGLLRKAQAAGISKRVLYEAKKGLNVQSVKEGSQWYWELPEK